MFAEHIALDRKEREEFLRDLVEYGMAFHNFEAVKQVQRNREYKQNPEYQQSEQAFLEQVEKLFGRKLDRSHLNQSDNNQASEDDMQQDLSDQEIPQQDIIRIRKVEK